MMARGLGGVGDLDWGQGAEARGILGVRLNWPLAEEA